jgi:hypothetical protein
MTTTTEQLEANKELARDNSRIFTGIPAEAAGGRDELDR